MPNSTYFMKYLEISCLLSHLSQSYFQLLALHRETKALNKSTHCSPCLPVQQTHTSQCSLCLRARMVAGKRAFHAEFHPTTQSLKTICESWGVQPDKEPPSAEWGRRILPFRPVDATTHTHTKKNPLHSVSEGNSVVWRLGLRTHSDDSISG